jgi:hypothetical protein
MKHPRYTALLVLLLLVPIVSRSGSNLRRVTAQRTPQPPVIDGILAEKEWQHATPATDFVQRDPLEGQPATERTEIRVLYDDEALYFGCMFYDSRPEGIVARLTRRDDEIESDRGSIRLDCFHDHQTSYEFTFNAAGVKIDILQYDDAEKEDESWDPIWDLKTSITPQGWVAEVKIPFGSLRYKTGTDGSQEQEWGINFYRWILRKQEFDRWAFTAKSQNGEVSRYGHLDGLRGLPPPRRAELLPFVLSSQSWQPATTSRDAFQELNLNAGLDMRFGINNNLTLDAAVNPDFGQVEADPAVLNLSTYETFYPEKRPFFIEGTQILKFSTFDQSDGGPGLFYSRRIGRAIASSEVVIPAGGKIVELPDVVRILGAAKVTGKTNAGLSVGVLEAMTAKESAIVTDSSGVRSEQLIAPFSSYGMVRLKQDILDGSNVGMVATAVVRDGRMPAFTAGGDWNVRFDERVYSFDGFLAGSSTPGTGDAIATGSAGRARLAKVAAVHWLWSLSGDFTSPHYDINDLGYFRRPNDFGAIAALRYKEDVPSGILYNYAIEGQAHERWNFDGANIIREVSLSGESTFMNWWEVYGFGSADVGDYDDRETRGNGLYLKPHRYTAGLAVQSDERGTLMAELGTDLAWDSKNGKGFELELGLGIRPVSWSSWNIAIKYAEVRDLEAWVENIEGPTSTLSIFADRSTREFDVTVRGTITFTPELTLQLYAQPFVGKGHYDGFRQLVGVGDFIPFPYMGNPDFNEQSFRSNVVLRWEYLPGSTLFLVWSQTRGNETSNYFSTVGEDLTAAFRTAPANVILLKISYWWPI